MASENAQLGAAGDQPVDITTKVHVSKDQLDAYKSLPAELQEKLGAPVHGHVLSAEALKALAGDGRNSLRPVSTIMCPW